MSTKTEFRLIDCRTEECPAGLRLLPESEQALVIEPNFYAAPLQVDCLLEIDGACEGLRLLFGAGQVVFGDTLLWVDPYTGEHRRITGVGQLPTGRLRIRLELAPTQARVLVNDIEWFAVDGLYARGLAGQVGLGIPSAATVTLVGLTITGEDASVGHTLRKETPLDFDGGLIDVLYDQHQPMLGWFEAQMGLKGNSWHGPTDREADATLFSTLSLPDHGAFHLYSVLTRKRLGHWFAERGTIDGHVRMTFRCPDLARTYARLQERLVRTSAIGKGPEGREFFDFYSPEGTRLTAISFPEQAEKYPEVDFTCFAPGWIEVTDLARSVEWYRELLGIEVTEDRSAESYVSLNAWLWLSAIPVEQHRGKVDDAARLYLVCPSRQQFTSLHERLAQAGAQPSPYMNPPGTRWSAFHFYDPDGNRLNVWSYY